MALIHSNSSELSQVKRLVWTVQQIVQIIKTFSQFIFVIKREHFTRPKKSPATGTQRVSNLNLSPSSLERFRFVFVRNWNCFFVSRRKNNICAWKRTSSEKFWSPKRSAENIFRAFRPKSFACQTWIHHFFAIITNGSTLNSLTANQETSF